MRLNSFVEWTAETAQYPGAGENNLKELSYLCLGLAGETGEAVDCIKKCVRLASHDHAKMEQFEEELGDVMWYWASLCRARGIDAEVLLEDVVDKLESRVRNGTIKQRQGGAEGSPLGS